MRKLLGMSLVMVGFVGIGTSAWAWPEDKPRTGAAPAAAAQTQTAQVGQKAPDFTLTDTNGTKHTLTETLKKEGVKAVVLEWFNHDCPVCEDHAKKKKTIIKLTDTYKSKGVVVLGVDSTFAHTGKEADVNKMIKEWGVNYPVLADFEGKVGKMYNAKTTPHMFVINKDGTLVYDGAIDNEKEKTGTDTINFVDQALKQVLAGQTVATSKTTPYGCSVKYKS